LWVEIAEELGTDARSAGMTPFGYETDEAREISYFQL